ncbi:MAG: hypothetical protein U5N85_08315 [Arcicella sp.]|nr:hypothetical protein [Arcicella sp.]
MVFEYLSTTSQGGATGGDNISARLRGQDGYFNNIVYRDGWTYNQDVIGSSLVSLVDNRVTSIYTGFEGLINNKTKFLFKLVEIKIYSYPSSPSRLILKNYSYAFSLEKKSINITKFYLLSQ